MLKYQVDNIDKLLKQLDVKIVEKALLSSTNRAADRLSTEISRRIRGRYNISATNVRQRLKVTRAVSGNLSAVIKITGKRMGLTSFGASTRKVTLGRKAKKGKGRPWGRFRVGVSVRVLKSGGKKPITSQPAFLAAGRSGNRHVFYRDPRGGKSSTGKSKIIAMKMLSVPGMANVVEQDAAADYHQFAMSHLRAEFDRMLSYLLGEKG